MAEMTFENFRDDFEEIYHENTWIYLHMYVNMCTCIWIIINIYIYILERQLNTQFIS